MTNDAAKKEVIKRLNKIEGQIRGIVKMVESNRYCIDVLIQTRAIVSAIRKVEDIVMNRHLKTCVAESFRSNNREESDEKIAEIMDILSRFRRGG